MRNRWVIIGAVLFVAGLAVYWNYRTPQGTVPMGGSGAETIAWIGLATSIVGLLTGVVSLIKEIVKARSTKGT